MNPRTQYTPGPAYAEVRKEGEVWTLVLVRDLEHPPTKVWTAITEPEHLKQWAPFDSDKSLATAGATAKLSTVGAPVTAETKIERAEAPKLLEYKWGNFNMRWELEPQGQSGTRLTLWTNIARPYIAMGAAGWQVCFDVLASVLDGSPLGRTVGPEAMQVEGWQKLHLEYQKKFSVETPSWK